MARIPISEIKAALNDRVEEFCRTYLPGGYVDDGLWRCSDIHGTAPKAKDGDGSFIVNLKGEKVGKVHDFSSGMHGDLLDVLEAQKGKDHLNEARRFLGLANGAPTGPAPAAKLPAETAAQSDRHYQESAIALWNKAAEIAKTHA